MISYLFVSVFY